MGQFEGRRALVTGGASGIGRATARRLAAEGAHVTVADVDVQLGKECAAEIGGDFVELDVSDPAAWAELAESLAADGLHLAFLNAGVTTLGMDPVEVSDAAYRRIMGVNVDGVFFGTRALAPIIQRSGGGDIVCTASLAGLIPFSPDAVYNLTKHAVVGWIRGAAPSLAGRGVRLNALCPALVDTPLLGEARAIIDAAGLPMLHADDIAEAYVVAATSGRSGLLWVCRPGMAPEPAPDFDMPGGLGFGPGLQQQG